MKTLPSPGEPSVAAPAHGGNLAWAAARYGLPPERFLDFSASLNPAGPPPAVLHRLRRALAGGVARYPDPDCRAAREALADRLGVPPEAVLLTNGGAEAIHLAARWWFSGPGKGGRMIVPAPSFSEYARAAAAAGAKVVYRVLDPAGGFRLEAAALAADLHPGDLVMVGNPNNPTGTLAPAGELNALHRLASTAGAALAVDEAFVPFTEGGANLSLASRAAREPGLLVVGSLTKYYCLPGLRAGYAVAPPGTVAALAALQPSWSVNGLAQEAILAAQAAEEADDPARLTTRLARARADLARHLAALPGLRVFPSDANFLLVDCRDTGRTAAEIADALGHQGILIRDCADFPGLGPYYFRVAVRTRRDHDALLAALARG